MPSKGEERNSIPLAGRSGQDRRCGWGGCAAGQRSSASCPDTPASP